MGSDPSVLRAVVVTPGSANPRTDKGQGGLDQPGPEDSAQRTVLRGVKGTSRDRGRPMSAGPQLTPRASMTPTGGTDNRRRTPQQQPQRDAPTKTPKLMTYDIDDPDELLRRLLEDKERRDRAAAAAAAAESSAQYAVSAARSEGQWTKSEQLPRRPTDTTTTRHAALVTQPPSTGPECLRR